MRRISCVVQPEDDGRQVGSLLKARLHMGRQGIRAAKFIDDGIMLDDLRVSAKDLFDTLHQTNKFDDELEGKFHDAIVRFKTSFATTQA